MNTRESIITLIRRYFMSSNEVAEYLGIPLGTLRQLVRRRQIPAIKFGKLSLFFREDVEKYREAK